MKMKHSAAESRYSFLENAGERPSASSILVSLSDAGASYACLMDMSSGWHIRSMIPHGSAQYNRLGANCMSASRSTFTFSNQHRRKDIGTPMVNGTVIRIQQSEVSAYV